MKNTTFLTILLSIIVLGNQQVFAKKNLKALGKAQKNAVLVNEGFNRCVNYLYAWQSYADSTTGLVPRNLTNSKDFWNAWDAAADNYPYMVLSSAMLVPDYFDNEALNILATERKLTSRIGALPDTYYFDKKGFGTNTPDTSKIIFGAAEYMKDGLIPITEWLGESPWSHRMQEMLDDLSGIITVVERIDGNWYGNSALPEVNGDLLQVLSRMYWLTRNQLYLEWAVDIADYYFTDTHLPTNQKRLRIRDHGCEIIAGLCEIYFTSHYCLPEKNKEWKPYMHQMLNTILENGRNSDGLFYDEVNPLNGDILKKRLADTFGYTFNAFYTVAMIDSVDEYREAIVYALENLNEKYRNHNWEGNADGYADAIEGTLNLYNRLPLNSVKEWLDSEIQVMWQFQKDNGIIEGWYGDGNFARTTLMYCLWKTCGILPDQWREDLKLGAVIEGRTLYISLESDSLWNGKLLFDNARHKDNWSFPVDYPRINQFQEWYQVNDETNYKIKFEGVKSKKVRISGIELKNGLTVTVDKNAPLVIKITDI